MLFSPCPWLICGIVFLSYCQYSAEQRKKKVKANPSESTICFPCTVLFVKCCVCSREDTLFLLRHFRAPFQWKVPCIEGDKETLYVLFVKAHIFIDKVTKSKDMGKAEATDVCLEDANCKLLLQNCNCIGGIDWPTKEKRTLMVQCNLMLHVWCYLTLNFVPCI